MALADSASADHTLCYLAQKKLDIHITISSPYKEKNLNNQTMYEKSANIGNGYCRV